MLFDTFVVHMALLNMYALKALVMVKESGATNYYFKTKNGSEQLYKRSE